MGKGKAMMSITDTDPEVVKLATEEAIAVGKVGRMVVQLKQELMHHVKHKQFEAAKTVCERVLMLAPRDKMILEALLLIEQKIELDDSSQRYPWHLLSSQNKTGMLRIKSLLALSFFFLCSSIANGSIFMEGGVQFPDTRSINGVELKRNGQGIRSLSLLGINYKLYVAGFYSRLPLMTEEDVMERQGDDCPMQFEFTFLREFGKRQVRKAWEMQTSHSISYKYDGYDKDVSKFIDLLTHPISSKGTITVQIIGNETILIFEGDRKGTIFGSEFQKAFLSMWFGENAVAEDLKMGLLNGSFHKVEQKIVASQA